MNLPDLSDDLWLKILASLPIPHLLNNCMLVNTRWRDLAVELTSQKFEYEHPSCKRGRQTRRRSKALTRKVDQSSIEAYILRRTSTLKSVSLRLGVGVPWNEQSLFDFLCGCQHLEKLLFQSSMQTGMLDMSRLPRSLKDLLLEIPISAEFTLHPPEANSGLPHLEILGILIGRPAQIAQVASLAGLKRLDLRLSHEEIWDSHAIKPLTSLTNLIRLHIVSIEGNGPCLQDLLMPLQKLKHCHIEFYGYLDGTLSIDFLDSHPSLFHLSLQTAGCTQQICETILQTQRIDGFHASDVEGEGLQDIVSNFDWARVLTEELYLETYDPLTVDWQNILRAPNLTKVHFGAGQQLEFENIQCLTRSVLETRHLQVFMTVHYCPGFTKKTWKYLESVGLSVYCDDDNCYVGPRQED